MPRRATHLQYDRETTDEGLQLGKGTVDEQKNLKTRSTRSTVSALSTSLSPETAKLILDSQALQSEIIQAMEPFVDRANALLASLEGRTFEIDENGFEESRTIVNAIVTLVKQAGQQLMYNGEPATVYCTSGPRSKRVQLKVATIRRRPQSILASGTAFPSLQISPITEAEKTLASP